ncbi:MAG: hypothetical protein RI947_288 [Candidatus Parcubacteria bacterium]|jgi:hypothetical protein
MESSSTHSFFETVSKVVIIIPVVIILIALVTQINKPSISSQSKKNTSAAIIPTDMPAAETKGMPLNLEGPTHCVAQNEQLSVSAYVKNKNIYAEVTKPSTIQNYLVNGDCLYQWEQKKFIGKKSCGMSQYIGLAETMAKFNMLTTDTLVKVIASLPTDDKTKSTVKTDYSNLKPVCENTEIKDSVFAIPGTVKFKLIPTPSVSLNTDD